MVAEHIHLEGRSSLARGGVCVPEWAGPPDGAEDRLRWGWCRGGVVVLARRNKGSWLAAGLFRAGGASGALGWRFGVGGQSKGNSMRKGTPRVRLGDICWWRKALLARGKGSETGPEPEPKNSPPRSSGCPPAARAKFSVAASGGEVQGKLVQRRHPSRSHCRQTPDPSARRPRNTPSGSGSSADPAWCGLRLEVLKGGKVSDPMPSDCLSVRCMLGGPCFTRIFSSRACHETKEFFFRGEGLE